MSDTAKDLTLREKLLKSKQPGRRKVTINDIEIEFRAPTVRDIQRYTTGSNPKLLTHASIIVDFAMVPGTNEAIFHEADQEVIEGWPFTIEISNLFKEFQKLILGIDIEEAVKNSLRTASN